MRSQRLPAMGVPFRARRGTSLVEVLVAMTVLLFGIFALVRLFPNGFTSILYGRNVTAAQALTHAMIQDLSVRSADLPDVVMARVPGPNNGLPAVDPALPVNEELLPYPRSVVFPPVNGSPPPDARFSDINQVRRVIGETTQIPAPVLDSPYARFPISVYLLSFSPIYSAATTRAGLGGVNVYAGTPLNRLVLNGPPAPADLAQLGPNSYGIDYDNAVLYFAPATTPRTFKLDLSYTVGIGPNAFTTVQSMPDNSILLPANSSSFDLRHAQPGFVPLPSGAQLQQGAEALYRSFAQLPAGMAFDSDPYEFEVLNPVIGLIGFNPLAAALGPTGPNQTAMSARIDYDVDDWHIIHEDRVVPPSAPHAVKLTLSNIEQVGNVDEYQESYLGLMKGYSDRPMPAAVSGVDLLIVDLETGLTIDSRTMQTPGTTNVVATPVNSPTNVTDTNGEINYLNGQFTMPDAVQWTLANGRLSPAEPVGGKRIRIYYRTQQNWGLQLTKAATEYVRVQTVKQLGYRLYTELPNGALLFPVQDHDQAVLVDYTWVENVQGQPITRTETGEYHQILDPSAIGAPALLAALMSTSQGSTPWWVQVDGALRGDYAQNSVNILRVRGVTVRSRAVWREGNRWRQLDLDSYIGRDRGT